MKKNLCILILLSSLINVTFAQKKLSEIPGGISENNQIQVQVPEQLVLTENVPEIFNGIWEGDDRYILFQTKEELDKIIQNDVKLTEDKYIWIYLKIFYGWYIDRAAEKTNRKNTSYRYDINDTVFRDVQNIKINFRPLIDGDKCCAYEIIVNYPMIKEPVVIPVCIIGDNLYLDFAIKTNEYPDEADSSEHNPLVGSWSSVGKVSGIKVSKPIVKENLISTYITNDSIYYIRYWKTDMPYSSDMAFFSDGKYKYEVPKHINSAGNIYTCVTGRSVTIRNVERKNLPLENYIMNEEGNVIAFDTPYMKRISNNCALSDMMEIVKVTNSRKAPEPDPLFPPAELDWHIEDINRLEAGNQIIQAVRRRQREFYEKYRLGLHY